MHFLQQLGLGERPGAGDGENVLGEDVECAGAEILGIELARLDGVQCGASFQIFEAVARHDQPLARLVQAVVGAADPLQQARAALGRPHLNNQFDIAPVDAKVQRSSGDQGPQFAVGHRRLDLAAGGDVEAAVVDADRQALVIGFPQLLKGQLAQGPGIGEHQGRLVPGDQLDDLLGGIDGAVPAPRHLALGDQNREVGIGPRLAEDQVDQILIAMRGEPAAIGVGVGDRRRQADAAEIGGEGLQAGEREGQQIAAFFAGEGVDFIDDDGFEASEKGRALRVRQQQAQALRRRQQDLRRADSLARLAVGRGVAGAGFDADGEAHFLDRRQQIALNIDRQGLQRRDVEGVEAFGRIVGEFANRREEPRQSLTGAGRRDQQGATPGPRPLEHVELMPAGPPAPAREPAFDDFGQWEPLGHRTGITTR